MTDYIDYCNYLYSNSGIEESQSILREQKDYDRTVWERKRSPLASLTQQEAESCGLRE